MFSSHLLSTLQQCHTSPLKTPFPGSLFNPDQGDRFVLCGLIKELQDTGVKIGLDGRGRWRDNIYVERFWRTLKHEDIHLKSCESVRDLKDNLSRFFRFYNSRRYRQRFDYRTRDEMNETFEEEVDRTIAWRRRVPRYFQRGTV